MMAWVLELQSMRFKMQPIHDGITVYPTTFGKKNGMHGICGSIPWESVV